MRPGPKPKYQAKYLLAAEPEEMREWQAAAALHGLPFSEWLRRACRFQCALPTHGIRVSRVKPPYRVEERPPVVTVPARHDRYRLQARP
jgi:hypothetical protein